MSAEESTSQSQSGSDEKIEKMEVPKTPPTADERLATAGRTQRQLGILFSLFVVLCLAWGLVCVIRVDKFNDFMGVIGAILLVLLGGASALVALFLFAVAKKTKARVWKEVEEEKKKASEKAEADAKQSRIESMIAELAAVRSETKTCSKCGAKMQIGTKFCPECGAPAKTKCAKCGTEVAPGVKFCPECGEKLA